MNAVAVEHEAAAEWAKGEAAKIAPGDYYASGEYVVEHGKPDNKYGPYGSHWRACLVMLAIGKERA